MSVRRGICAVLIASSIVTAQRVFPRSVSAQRLPHSTLAVRQNSATRPFWRSDSAPTHWTIAPLAPALQWRTIARGVETATLLLAGTGEAWRTRLVAVRLDPSQLTFSLDTAATPSGQPAWNLKRAPSDAVFAMNAGQFRSIRPWGLVVLDGTRLMPAERGPLAATIAVDSTNTLRWLFDDEPTPTHVALAFQSYPVLLRSSDTPFALQQAERGVDVAHRDARLALGRLVSGQLIVVMSRFDGLGPSFGSVPFGLTVPEMSAVMGALGALDAVLLDGGISAQLFAGQGASRITESGWRDVPLAFIARSRRATRP